MKTFERILMKIVMIQFIILVISQLLFHRYQIFPELNQLTKYEGVTDYNFSEVLETFKGR
jgi:hypothetical protein